MDMEMISMTIATRERTRRRLELGPSGSRDTRARWIAKNMLAQKRKAAVPRNRMIPRVTSAMRSLG
jgi:hypothetical protein